MNKIVLPIVVLLLTVSCGERVEPADTATSDPSAVATAAGPPPVATTGSPVPAAAQGENRVNVRVVDYRFEMPNQLPAGTTRFLIRNDGKHKHNFEIEGEGIEEELEQPLGTGQSGELTVDLKPGRYRVYCPVGDHATKHGMETTVNVI